jgi:hypothetical protein
MEAMDACYGFKETVIMTTTVDFADMWSPLPPGAVVPPPGSEDYTVWLIRMYGDPEWNPDRADHAMTDWRDEMIRLIASYQRSRGINDARCAAIHHAKLMHRHLLDLGYPASAERDVETFLWWMTRREAWWNESSAAA